MYEYIAKFGDMVEHAYGIKLMNSASQIYRRDKEPLC